MDPSVDALAHVDAAAESRAMLELSRGRHAGEVLRLPVGDAEVLALWRPRETGPERGTVVLLHGETGSVDDPAVTGALRRDLPRHGFATLALMLPTPARGAARAGSAVWLAPVRERLSAALAWLEQQDAPPVRALVGHGSGAAFVKRLLDAGETPIKGWAAAVLIDPGPGLQPEEALWKGPLVLPVLDLVAGAAGMEPHRLAALRRASALRVGGADYRSVLIPGVLDDWFPARGRLVAAVRGFLLRHTPPGAVTGP